MCTALVQLYWWPSETVGKLILAMKEKKIALHCKKTNKQLTSKWRIQEIREIFGTLVLVRSRKYFQLLCFNPCLLFLSKKHLFTPFFLFLPFYTYLRKIYNHLRQQLKL